MKLYISGDHLFLDSCVFYTTGDIHINISKDTIDLYYQIPFGIFL